MTPSVTLFTCCADTCLGKIDKHTMSHQTLMELFIEKVENPENIYGVCDNPKPISQWRGRIEYDDDDWVEWSVRCNTDSEVSEIYIGSRYLRGSIQLEWLPETTKSCYMPHNQLSGTINLRLLPGNLEHLWLQNNALVGTVDLKELPDKLISLLLFQNALSGKIDLTQLSPALKNLQLGQNDLSGETDFSRLPKSLNSLNVSNNSKLSGTFCFEDWDGTYFSYSSTKVKTSSSLDEIREMTSHRCYCVSSKNILSLKEN